MSQPEPLELIAETNRKMAERAKAPAWYHPLLGAITGGILAAQPLPPVGLFGVYALCIVGMVFLVGSYRRKTGMWVSGYRAGRTRWVAVGLATVYGALFIGTLAYQRETGSDALFPWAGLAAAIIVTIGGHLWEKAYRIDLGVEGR